MSLGGPGPVGPSGKRLPKSLSRQTAGSRTEQFALTTESSGRKEATGEATEQAAKLREDISAFRAGKITAAGLYITLALAFGIKRNAMVPKVL